MPKKTILLVDDDTEIVKIPQHYLQHKGYAVLVAYNGKDTLTIVRDHMPDCIVLDIMMPNHNG